jgi:hypothetical protein
MCAEKYSRVCEGTSSGALHIKPFKSVDMIRGHFTLVHQGPGVNNPGKIHPMPRELVQQAINTLKAAGQPISLRKVNRVMRAMPPYFGMSFRDLLPFLRHQHDTPKECYRQVLELTAAFETALAHPHDTDLPALLSRGEAVWRTCTPRLQAASLSVDGPTAATLWPLVVHEFRYRLAAVTEVVRG